MVISRERSGRFCDGCFSLWGVFHAPNTCQDEQREPVNWAYSQKGLNISDRSALGVMSHSQDIGPTCTLPGDLVDRGVNRL